jgi:hypothetical protein
MTLAANPSGKRADGTHWQSDKVWCVRGHDIRPLVNGQPNPNVRRHVRTGTRQCIECSRLRSRLTVRLRTARQWWADHQATCQRGCQTPGKYCDEGAKLRATLIERTNALTAAGFDASPSIIAL